MSVVNGFKLYVFRSFKVSILLVLYFVDIILTFYAFLFHILLHRQLNKCNENEPASKHIVIVGYSFAGFEIHKLLQTEASLQHFTFTVIEPKTYFEFTPSVLVSMVNPTQYKSVSFPLSECFDATRSVLINGKAIQMDTDSNTVTVQKKNGQIEEIIFDFCFICTGSKYAEPIKANNECDYTQDQRQQTFEKTSSKIKNAQSIGIIGGGPVGCELLAEIIQRYPHKKVTLFDANCSLCHSFPISTQKYLEKWMKTQKNVRLKLGTRIKEIERNKKSEKSVVIIEKKGEKFEFDVVFKCGGFEPNCEILGGAKNEFIKVNEWMNVSESENVFAFGDVVDVPFVNEIKLAHTAEIHARYLRDLMLHSVVANANKYLPYHKWLFGTNKNEKFDMCMPLIYTISLGEMDGSMAFGKIRMNGWLSQMLKWFIEISLCTLYRRKGIFKIGLFKIYPFGFRIFSILWWFNHRFTLAYIRYTAS